MKILKILIFTICSIVYLYEPIAVIAARETVIETEGDKSPAIYAPTANEVQVSIGVDEKTINDTINKATSDINNNFEKMLNLAIEYQDRRLDELNKELHDIYLVNATLADADAEKWAQEIIEQSPQVIKAVDDKNKLVDEYNIETSKNIVSKTYMLFSYVFEYVDSRFAAIKKISPEMNYEINEYSLFFNENANRSDKIARTATLPNGVRIEVIINPGVLEEGLVKSCPTAIFNEVGGQNNLSFRLLSTVNQGTTMMVGGGGSILKKHEKITINDVKYNVNNEFPTDSIKKFFNQSFDKLILYTYGK